MALPDPLVLPHSGGDITMPKIAGDGYSSEYFFKGALSEHRVKIRHSKTKPSAVKPAYDRHNVEVTEVVFAAGDVAEYYRKAYFVIEQLPADVDVELMDSLADWALVTTNLYLDALMGWES
jgi:hypothetical protein